MYVAAHFAESDLATLHAVMAAYPFATLVTQGGEDGLTANHLPLQLLPEASAKGTLRGHVARANPVWRSADAGAEALVVFQGPDGYISPSGYATKARHGRVVPTWNYVAVHAYGTLRVIDDKAWLRAQVEALTQRHEASQSAPWAISDAPADYVNQMLAAIVGIEIVITRLVGKWKVSQNQPAENQLSLTAALDARGDAEAKTMAALIRQHGAK
jgi:transcriptional regulator